MSCDQVDYIIKTIIIGDTGVGKTTLMRKLTEKQFFYNNTPTIGVDFFTVKTKINNTDIKINIWDTAGHERYKTLVKSYFKNNSICYVVYDVCNKSTFMSVPYWINTFKTNSSNTHALIVILANKVDNKTKRVVGVEEGLALAKKFNAQYIEISSLASVGLNKIIIEPVTQLLELYKQKQFTSGESSGFKLGQMESLILNKKKNKLCCNVQ
jgi:small GTP-binding protein